MKHKTLLSCLLLLSFLFSGAGKPLKMTAEAITATETFAAGHSETEAVFEDVPQALPMDIGFGPAAAQSAEAAFQCNILEYVDREAFANAGHVRRAEEWETLSSYAFENADGTNALYIFKENVKYIAADGRVREKDLTLRETQAAQAYTTASNDIGLVLPKNAAEGISLSYQGLSAVLTPMAPVSGGAGSTAEAAAQPMYASKDAVQNEVAYGSVLGTHTALRFTPTLSGVRGTLSIAAYTGQNTFYFRLYTNGCSVFLRPEGGFYLAESAEAQKRIHLDSILVCDAHKRLCAAEISVAPIREAEEYAVTVSVDKAFLTDSTTAYPLSVYSTLRVSDADTGGASIQDATVFSGKPTLNTGSWIYATVGYGDSDYQVGRTMVRLNGLYTHGIYTSLSESQINSVKFYYREATGTAARTINLYRNTGNASWTESNVTWNNAGTYSTASNWGTSAPQSAYACFDITSLVKGWKSGAYNAAMGFVLVNPNESSISYKKQFDTSETGSYDNKPYVVMEYMTNFSVSPISAYLTEGGTLQLSAQTNPAGGTVTWTSSDTKLATVSSSGLVTGLRAGYPMITAHYTDPAGNTYTDTCQIYLILKDGVYYIRNAYSNRYLHAANGGIANGTNVYQDLLYNTDPQKLFQLWKIKYLDAGQYSVRPMHKLNMGLCATDGNADIRGIGTSDTYSGVDGNARWAIVYRKITDNTYGYVFENSASSGKALTLTSASLNAGVNVNLQRYQSGNTLQFWNLSRLISPPEGLMLYHASGGNASNTTKWIAPNYAKSLSSLNLAVAVYSGDTISQSVTWSSGNEFIARVNSSTGTVTSVSPGTTIISATADINGRTYTKSYTVKVSDLADGIYFIANKKTQRYTDIAGQVMADGTIIHQWDYHGGDSIRWTFQLQSDGYYTIQSCKASTRDYYLAVQGNSAGNAAVVLKSGTITDGMKWKVTILDNGSYQIASKTGESGNRVLSVKPYSSNANGIAIEQLVYSNDTDYRDEWYLSTKTISRVLNIDVIYDGAYDARFPDQVKNRINVDIMRLRKLYLDRFHIYINASLPSQFTSYGDLCARPQYFNNCQCSTSCNRSSLNADLSVSLSPYHHKNIYNILLRIPFADTNKTGRLAFIGHRVCDSNPSCRMGPRGLTQRAVGISTVCYYMPPTHNHEIMTTIHEIGHLFGVKDHYGGEAPDTDEELGQARNCIYGEDRENSAVLNNMTICSYCTQVIESNVNWYSHWGK